MTLPVRVRSFITATCPARPAYPERHRGVCIRRYRGRVKEDARTRANGLTRAWHIERNAGRASSRAWPGCCSLLYRDVNLSRGKPGSVDRSRYKEELYCVYYLRGSNAKNALQMPSSKSTTNFPYRHVISQLTLPNTFRHIRSVVPSEPVYTPEPSCQKNPTVSIPSAPSNHPSGNQKSVSITSSWSAF